MSQARWVPFSEVARIIDEQRAAGVEPPRGEDGNLLCGEYSGCVVHTSNPPLFTGSEGVVFDDEGYGVVRV